MSKRMLLTGAAEFTAFGLLVISIVAWAVALAPLR